MDQPSLEMVASHVGLSPFHFQRLFRDWAGVSPKKFLQYMSLEHAKTLLRQNHSVLDASFGVGLSGSSRLHDLFMNIEGMTPGDYKNGGENLTINYSFSDTLFGKIILASTEKGICYLAFCNTEVAGLAYLKEVFPKSRLTGKPDDLQHAVLKAFGDEKHDLSDIKLHIKGTPFQLKVWHALLQVPFGSLVTYADIARSIDRPKATRAVGTAIGRNPIAYIIPCHRVIQSTGIIGGYRWGRTRKQALLGWESAQR